MSIRLILGKQLCCHLINNTWNLFLNMWLFFKIFIGVWLLYNVVLASTAQQNESAIHIQISPPFWTSLSFRLPQCWTCGSLKECITRFPLKRAFNWEVCIHTVQRIKSVSKDLVVFIILMFSYVVSFFSLHSLLFNTKAIKTNIFLQMQVKSLLIPYA